MGRVIRLTESDLRRLVKRIIKENEEEITDDDNHSEIYNEYLSDLKKIGKFLNDATMNPKFNWKSEKMGNALTQLYLFKTGLKYRKDSFKEGEFEYLMGETEEMYELLDSKYFGYYD